MSLKKRTTGERGGAPRALRGPGASALRGSARTDVRRATSDVCATRREPRPDADPPRTGGTTSSARHVDGPTTRRLSISNDCRGRVSRFDDDRCATKAPCRPDCDSTRGEKMKKPVPGPVRAVAARRAVRSHHTRATLTAESSRVIRNQGTDARPGRMPLDTRLDAPAHADTQTHTGDPHAATSPPPLERYLTRHTPQSATDL